MNQQTREIAPVRHAGILGALRLMMLLGLIGFCLFQAVSLLGQYELPDCNTLLKAFEYQDCRWEVESGKGRIHLKLIVDEQVVAENLLEPTDVLDDFDFQDAAYKEGWGAYIEVDPKFVNEDLGERLWRLGDRLLREQEGPGEVRIFIDASENPGFAAKIRRLANPVFVSPDGDFIYIVN